MIAFPIADHSLKAVIGLKEAISCQGPGQMTPLRIFVSDESVDPNFQGVHHWFLGENNLGDFC